MVEHRRHNRYILENCDVRCKMLFATEVKLLDISLGGASIVTNKRLNIGGRYTLKILTDTVTLQLHSEAVWERLFASKKTPGGDVVPLFKAGLKFNTVLTGEGARLLEFISSSMDTSQFRPRIGGVRIHVPEGPASLGAVEDAHLKKITETGMVLEAEASLETGSRITIELLFPGETQAYPLLCRIRSCGPSKELPGAHEIELEFMDMGPGMHARLAEFTSLRDGSTE